MEKSNALKQEKQQQTQNYKQRRILSELKQFENPK